MRQRRQILPSSVFSLPWKMISRADGLFQWTLVFVFSKFTESSEYLLSVVFMAGDRDICFARINRIGSTCRNALHKCIVITERERGIEGFISLLISSFLSVLPAVSCCIGKPVWMIDHLGCSVVRTRTVGPSRCRRGPRQAVTGRLHGVIELATRSSSSVGIHMWNRPCRPWHVERTATPLRGQQ